MTFENESYFAKVLRASCSSLKSPQVVKTDS
jgi:hypothetical protein